MRAPHTVRHAPHHAPAPARHPKTVAKKPAPPVKAHKKPAPAKKPAKPPAKKPVRKWSPGADVACCAAEAFGTVVAASGRPWSAEDTLALYWATAAGPDAGATLLETLEAAARVAGLGAAYKEVTGQSPAGMSYLLGVALPEPHAIAVTPGGRWWSWGQPFNPAAWPGLVVEETWAVIL